MTDSNPAKQPANSKTRTKRSSPGNIAHIVSVNPTVRMTARKKVKAIGGRGNAKGLSNEEINTVTPLRSAGTQKVKVKQGKLDEAESANPIERLKTFTNQDMVIEETIELENDGDAMKKLHFISPTWSKYQRVVRSALSIKIEKEMLDENASSVAVLEYEGNNDEYPEKEKNNAICPANRYTSYFYGNTRLIWDVSWELWRCRQAITTQARLGPFAFAHGFLVQDWETAQKAYLQSIGPGKSAEHWLGRTIQYIWNVSWDLWRSRCTYLHSSEKIREMVLTADTIDGKLKDIFKRMPPSRLLHPTERRALKGLSETMVMNLRLRAKIQWTAKAERILQNFTTYGVANPSSQFMREWLISQQ